MYRCCVCGQFCRPVDVGAYYNFDSFEEPEDQFFCLSCGKSLLHKAVNNPENIIIGCWWLKPNFVRVAKSVLRQRKKQARKQRTVHDALEQEDR